MFKIARERIKWLDIAKGIAILLMIAGHISLIPWDPFRKIIFSVHMPLFFIAAGYALGIHNGKIKIKQSAKRLLIPYCATAILTSALIYNIKGTFNFMNEIERLIWASGVPTNYGPGLPVTGEATIPVIGAIWFLPCMFFGKLLFQSILHLLEKRSEYIRAAAVILISAIGYIVGQHYKIPLGIDISLFSTIFFYAGYLMKKFNLMEKKLHIIGIAAMLLWYLAIRFNGIEMSARFYRDFPYCIFVILGAAAGSFVIFAVSSEILEQIPLISSFLIFCGKNSLTILCIHHLESYLISWTELFSNTALAGHPFRAGILIAAIRIIFDIAATKLFIIVKEKISRSYQKIRF